MSPKLLVLGLALAGICAGCERGKECEPPLHPAAAVVAKADIRKGMPLLEGDYEATEVCTHNPPEPAYTDKSIQKMHGQKLLKSVGAGEVIYPSHFGIGRVADVTF